LAGFFLGTLFAAFDFVLGLRFFEGGGFDFRLDLVAQIDLAGIFAVGLETVPPAKLAKLGRGHVELVRDPGVRPALADPCANLIQL
jgi:hypothetical protein